MAEALKYFITRAVDVDADGFGTIAVCYSDMSAPPGLTNRRISGLKHLGDTPVEMERELKLVPLAWCGLSPFALPRPLRHILRHNVQVSDIDGVNAMFNLLDMVRAQWERPGSLWPKTQAVDAYRANRSNVVANIARWLDTVFA